MDEQTIEELMVNEKEALMERMNIIKKLYQENLELSKELSELILENEQLKKKVRIAKTLKEQLDKLMELD